MNALRQAQGKAARRVWAFERGRLWAMDLANGRQPHGAATAPVIPRVAAAFGEIRRETADRLAAAMGLPDPELVLRRFATGRRCFAAWVEDRIAAYGWVSQSAECIGELEREIRIQGHEAYIWNCETLPSYRGQRLYSALLSQMVRELQRGGVRRVWIGSSLENRPSIRGFVNAGFQPAVTLYYVRLSNLRCLWVSSHPAAPGALVAAARRALAGDGERAWGSLVVGVSRPAQLTACAQIEA